jgi:hypothetical protein
LAGMKHKLPRYWDFVISLVLLQHLCYTAIAHFCHSIPCCYQPSCQGLVEDPFIFETNMNLCDPLSADLPIFKLELTNVYCYLLAKPFV